MKNVKNIPIALLVSLVAGFMFRWLVDPSDLACAVTSAIVFTFVFMTLNDRPDPDLLKIPDKVPSRGR